MNKLPLLLLFLLFSCSEHKNDEQINEYQSHKNKSNIQDTLKTNSSDKKTRTQELSSNTVFISELQHFYNSNDVYVSLYYRKEYSEEADQALKNAIIKNFDEDIDRESRRYIIKTNIAQEHLFTDQLDTMYVLDSVQKITDTLILQHYELYSNMISEEYIASYKTKKSFNNCTVINTTRHLKRHYPSPYFYKDSLYLNSVMKANHIVATHIHDFGVTEHRGDSLLYLSMANYDIEKEALYIFQNGIPVDSIIRDYVFQDLKPVPFASESSIGYTAHFQVPESDIFWKGIVFFNLKNKSMVICKQSLFKPE